MDDDLHENDSSIFDRSGDGKRPESDPSLDAVRDSEEDGITPGFLGGSDWPEDAAYKLNGDYYGGNDRKLKRKREKDNAANDLASIERNARDDTLNQPNDDGLEGNRYTEASARGLYSGKGKHVEGKVKIKKGKGGSKGKKGGKKGGKLKKKGPLAWVLTILFGTTAAISGMQLSQPFSLIAQFQETFNSMHVSANVRSKSFFRYQMNNKRNKYPVRGKIFGGKTFKITEKQESKLRQHGIEYDDDFQGNRVFKYDDGSGEIRIIVADQDTAKALGDIDGTDPSTGKVYSRTPEIFDDIYENDVKFHHDYNAGSMTWRGRIANWFGSRVAAFLKNNKLTRNLFENYESKKAEAGGDGVKVMQDTLEQRVGDVEDGGEKVTQYEEKKDQDGNTVIGEDGKPVSEQKKSSTDSTKLERNKISSLKGKMEKIKSKFASSANVVCGIANAVGAITLAVQAAEALQIINLVTAYFETVDKVKAGDGDEAPVNEMANTLNEPKESTYTVLEDNQNGSVGDISTNNSNEEKFDNEGTYSALSTKTTRSDKPKSAMQSNGIGALFGGTVVDPDDPSAKSFNLTSSIKDIMWGVGAAMDSFETCTIAKMAASIASAVFDAIDIFKCIASVAAAVASEGAASGALVTCIDLLKDIGISIAKGVAIGLAISAVFNTLMPILVKSWTRDLISNIGGEDLGNALTSGGNMYLGGAHRANGGSPASYDKYKQFAVWQQAVIADNARFEREHLDPFDYTSKYTFLGSLVNKLSVFSTVYSIAGVLSSGSSVVSSSLVALGPSASAYDIAKSLPENEAEYNYEDTCPYLASINMVGDSFCNPYVMTDMSTIGDDPVDVVNKVDDLGGLSDDTTSDGNVKIDGDSQLAKYIRYCDGRNSMFGVADYNIAADINSGTSANTGNSYTDAAINGAIGSIPVFGDGIDIYEDKNALDHIGYISGESCVAGNDVNAAESPDWEEAKYYQRFIEDQSLAESMGVIEKSAVTAYLEDYYKEHPLDNSYEGVIARYSGLDKDTVTDIMDIAEYYEYINDYNPVERYAFGEPAVKMEKKIEFDNDYDVASDDSAILISQISYADVRNRSFAV